VTHQLKKSARRYDADWLRVIFVCGLIMIHVAAMFDPYPITAVKGHRSFPLILFATFLHEWRLAILFIVSGAASYFALGFLSGRGYALMRIRRILVPLIMGTFLIVPIHLYYWQFQGSRTYNKTYLQFYGNALRRLFFEGAFGTSKETLYWAHLWYLFYLFVASLIALPLFLYLRHGKGQQLIPRLADFFEKPWAIFLLALPIMLLEVTLRAASQPARAIIIGDWSTFTVDLVLFIYGFILFSHDKFRQALEAHRKPALVAAIVTSLIYLFMVFGVRFFYVGYNLKFLLYMALRGFSVWCWCVAVLGHASRHLNFNHRLLPYLNEAVYPVYVVHLPLVTMIAYRVVRWPLPALVEFAIIVIASLAVALIIFDLIRRTKITRFLFGLKVNKSKQARMPATESAVTPSA
jgi:peptidoglycan/LPS O-acetylase OafA/YrhL